MGIHLMPIHITDNQVLNGVSMLHICQRLPVVSVVLVLDLPVLGSLKGPVVVGPLGVATSS